MSKKEKYKKLYFLKAPKGYGYHANQVEDVPESLAKEFINSGVARKAESTLPEDIPGREVLLANGIDSLEDVEAIGDFTSVKGIGSKINEELTAYFDRGEEPLEEEEDESEEDSEPKTKK